eukprot:6490642-Amphidinium_carterae.2
MSGRGPLCPAASLSPIEQVYAGELTVVTTYRAAIAPRLCIFLKCKRAFTVCMKTQHAPYQQDAL